MDDVLLRDDAGGVRTLTLNRPKARNALNVDLIGRLTDALAEAEADDAVAAVILTGADPAFCAGLDLREVGEKGIDPALVLEPRRSPWWMLASMRTPVIGAVNGPAITGGLELALQCSFLVASELAAFADTHARVGLHPGGGLSGLLPQAVGAARAKEMSFTGRFVKAVEAERIGLVNHVVDHEHLLTTARRLAEEIAAADGPTVLAIHDTYRAVAGTTLAEGLELERQRFAEWKADPAAVEARRQAVTDRGKSQLS